MAIHFYFEKNISLRNRTQLKNFIQSVFKKEGKRLESLNYIFCSDKRLLEINRDFLNHDFYTDIITFDLTEKGKAGITAEVYISTDRVRDNAIQFNTSLTHELHRVIFHGVLHLCGYNDKGRAAETQMRKMEEKYLAAYFDS